MMRQSEFNKKYDPELGRYTRQHIYGEGVMDVFKSFDSKIFGKTMKKAAKTAATKALTTAATKTGEHVGKKAGDKIIEMLSKSNTPKKVTFDEVSIKRNPTKKMTREDINQRLNYILKIIIIIIKIHTLKSKSFTIKKINQYIFS